MILSPSNKQTSDRMGGQSQQDSFTDTPPTYQVAVEETNGIVRVQQQHLDQKIPPQAQGPVAAYQSNQPPILDTHTVPGPSGPNPGIPSMPQTRVYHYINPANGNHISSLLPPDHPEMVCLQEGSHVEETKFGLLGIIAAIIWFPFGIGLCILDRTVTCKRCGAVIKGRPGIHLGGSSRRNRQ